MFELPPPSDQRMKRGRLARRHPYAEFRLTPPQRLSASNAPAA